MTRLRAKVRSLGWLACQASYMGSLHPRATCSPRAETAIGATRKRPARPLFLMWVMGNRGAIPYACDAKSCIALRHVAGYRGRGLERQLLIGGFCDNHSRTHRRFESL